MESSIAQEIAAKIASLPIHMQAEVLRIVDSLVETAAVDSTSPVERRRLFGSLEHLHIKLTDDDIKQARREMWGEYMREDDQ
jgi:hypothetical protein